MKKLNSVSVVALGPVDSTFSGQAYEDLARRCGRGGADVSFISAKSNQVVVEQMFQQSSAALVQGVLAVETLAGGGIQESLFSLHRLLGHDDQELSVLAGVEKKIHLALMARPGLTKGCLAGVVAHARALGACRSNLARLKVEERAVDTNGEGIERVAWKECYAKWGAIGPANSAKKYGLKVLSPAFEDGVAITTFLLLQRGKGVPVVGERNRVILLCKLRHDKASLHRLLGLLQVFNLTQVHSIYVGDRTYDFLLEFDCARSQLETWQTVFNCLTQVTMAHRCFGPFAVYS